MLPAFVIIRGCVRRSFPYPSERERSGRKRSAGDGAWELGRRGKMPTDIVMPQMGESIVEGTITKWLKKPGDKVQRDEPLFEISTDKVDAEIPSPAAGVLQEIKVAEGATVQVNTVVGTITSDGEEVSASPAKSNSQ